MTTFLKKWDTLINEDLCPYQDSLSQLSDEEITALIRQSENEVKNVRESLFEYLVNSHSISDKQEFVKVNQALLIRLLNRLYTCMSPEVPEIIFSLYKIIGGHLQAALEFIEEFFGNYADKHINVPLPYLEIGRKEIKALLNKASHLILVAAIDSRLANAILESIKTFICCKNNKPTTYLDLSYHKLLLKELLSKDSITTQSIRKTLYQLNFNQFAFIEFEMERLQELMELEIKSSKISLLRFEQKVINQFPEKLNTVYDASMPSLKEQVNSWIETEIKFLESGITTSNEQSPIDDNKEKINTSLSVAKLALIIRLLVVDKIIINRTVAPMLRVVGRVFTTLQKDEISFGSLETKYHAPDKSTITAVRDMLFKWINILGRL